MKFSKTSKKLPEVLSRLEIEKILASGLDDIYLSLTPEKRQKFKKAGQETAAKIYQKYQKVLLMLY